MFQLTTTIYWEITMAVSHIKLLNLLGKQVSFSWLGADGVTFIILVAY